MASDNPTKTLCLSNGVEKRCSDCQQILPVAEFQRNKKTADHLQNVCKKCKSRMMRAYYANRKINDPTYMPLQRKTAKRNFFEKQLKRFGLTLEQYEALAAKGCCICGAHPDGEWTSKRNGRLAFDHDHEGGQFRGLLCEICNRGIGYFKDNPVLLLKAAEYLKNQNGG